MRLIEASDELLSFAAFTNKYGIWQDGVNDVNVLRGPVQLQKLATTSLNNFVQSDGSGNLSSQAAYVSPAAAAYTDSVNINRHHGPFRRHDPHLPLLPGGHMVGWILTCCTPCRARAVRWCLSSPPSGAPVPGDGGGIHGRHGFRNLAPAARSWPLGAQFASNNANQFYYGGSYYEITD